MSYKKDRQEYKEVLKRDNYTCQLCYKPYAHIHHIQYKSLGGANIRKNLICLCKTCHDMVHNDSATYKPILMDKMRFHYGCIEESDLKKKGNYANFAFPK